MQDARANEPTKEDLLQLVELLREQVKGLQDELAVAKKMIFGRRGERLEPGQLWLYKDGQLPAAEPHKPAAESVATTAAGHGRKPFAEDLPRDTVELDIPVAERTCGCCGKPLQFIGHEATERGHFVPARLVVRKYNKYKYACPDGHEVRWTEAPPALIERCKYEPSVYAHVAHAKYGDHVPLNRLSSIFRRNGMDLPKQTAWDMIKVVDELVAQPVLKQMRSELLESRWLQADETSVALSYQGSKGNQRGWLWAWRAPGRDGPDRVLIEFNESRGRDAPTAFLGDWKGVLQVDGYSSYSEVIERNGIIRAGCWAHARRKFKDALDGGASDAALVLRPMQEFFALEREAAEAVDVETGGSARRDELRREARRTRGRELVDEIYAVAGRLDSLRSTLPKSSLGKAIAYLYRQRPALEAVLDHPELPIHNNDCERDLRHVAVGRKNWMIVASERGGEVAGRMYSLVLSCKHAGVNPEAYLEDVLTLVSTTPASQVARLTPWAWAERRSAAGAVATATVG